MEGNGHLLTLRYILVNCWTLDRFILFSGCENPGWHSLCRSLITVVRACIVRHNSNVFFID